MGEEMLGALGYAYVRQTLKRRRNAASGAGKLGGLYEGVLQGAHSLTEASAAVGSAVGMAADLSKLSRDSQPDTPAEKKLSDAQRAALTERVQKRTLALVWRMTKHTIESTARAVVDQVLGLQSATSAGRKVRGVCPFGTAPGDRVALEVEGRAVTVEVPPGTAEGEEFEVSLPDDGRPPGPSSLGPAELEARAEALVYIGGVFSGETA